VLAVMAAAGAVTLPAAAIASTGGGGVTGSGSSGSGSTQASVQPGNGIVSASGSGMMVQTRASALLRNQVTFSGSAPGSDAGAIVEIQRSGHQTGWKWANTAHSTIARDGSFTIVWRANHIGEFAFRAVVFGGHSTRAAASTPSLTVIVYRPSVATQYGPGFWGHKTACGQVLRKSTIGLANKTLPCGTRVAIYYRGHTVIVPVIDRGPYTTGVDWDLTEATAQALGIPGTATIGAVSLRSQPAH
jgi:hypothetical protein